MKDNKLTNKRLLLWNSGFSIAINLFKAVWVFQTVSFTNTSIPSVIYSILAMAIVEFSIIVFLANGKTKDSIGFAVLSVVINLYYFNGLQFEDLRLNVVHVIFSFLLPYISARMAHVYIERVKEESEKQSEEKVNVHQDNENLTKRLNFEEEENAKLVQSNEKRIQEVNNLTEQVNQLTSQLEAVQTFENQQRLKNKKLMRKERINEKQIKNLTLSLGKYKANHEKYIELTTCPHCGKSDIHPKGMSNHTRSCEKNPESKNYKNVEQLQLSPVNNNG